MKKLLYTFVILISSCASSVQQDKNRLHDLDTDFPVADTITLNPILKQTFENMSNINNFIVRDTIMYCFENNDDNFGYCYGINSGVKLSTIINKGKANNEMTSIVTKNNMFIDDSIQFIDTKSRIIKIFSINDILTKPMNERVFSTYKLPDEIINTFNFTKYNNIILGTSDYIDDTINYKYFTLENGKVSLFGNVKKEIFEPEMELNRAIISGVFNITNFTNHNEKFAVANFHGIVLQVIDVNKKIVKYDRYYQKFKIEESDGVIKTMPTDYKTISIGCDEKYIYCQVRKSARGEINGKIILVFDWELNPIKKYFIRPHALDKNRFYISKDSKSLYYLTTEDEKPKLYENKLF